MVTTLGLRLSCRNLVELLKNTMVQPSDLADVISSLFIGLRRSSLLRWKGFTEAQDSMNLKPSSALIQDRNQGQGGAVVAACFPWFPGLDGVDHCTSIHVN